MNVYPAQTDIRLSVTFSALNGTSVPTDPTTVTLTVTRPDGTPVDTAIIHDGTGLYHCDVVGDLVGVWQYRWQGTGALIAASPTGLFRVN